jgi:hypothetical protein
MMRPFFAGLLGLTLVVALPAPAVADVTGFFGFSPTGGTRGSRGFAVGAGLVLVGFEFEFCNTSEDIMTGAPSVRTGMFNGLIQTPTSGVQLYATAGGGFYREASAGRTETNFGTNIGIGAKVHLVGPLRLRLDYRVFTLRGDPLDTLKTAQRFYAGVNVSF